MERRALSHRSAGTSFAPRQVRPRSSKFTTRKCFTPALKISNAADTLLPRAAKQEDDGQETTTRTATEHSTSRDEAVHSRDEAVHSRDEAVHSRDEAGHSRDEAEQLKLAWLSGSTESVGADEAAEGETDQLSSRLLAAVPILGLGLLVGGGYVFQDSIRAFLQFFVTAVDEWGPGGYAAYAGMYVALEVLCVPAIPLTMTAGVIFGPYVGTAIVSACSTAAATISFLIARYAAREKVLELASKNARWASIDRAIGKDGLKFVTLLRLSPLLPLSASNYLYGLTSVDLGSYVLGSWIGMLPGTYAYVTAGDIGKAVLMKGEGSVDVSPFQVGIGLGVTLLVLGYVGQLAKKAVEDSEKEDEGTGI